MSDKTKTIILLVAIITVFVAVLLAEMTVQTYRFGDCLEKPHSNGWLCAVRSL